MFDVPLDYSIMAIFVLIAAFGFRVRGRLKTLVNTAMPSNISLQVIPDHRYSHAHGVVEIVPEYGLINPALTHGKQEWVTEPPRLLYFIADNPDLLLRPNVQLFRKIVQDIQPAGWKITNIAISYQTVNVIYDYTFWTSKQKRYFH